MPVATPEQYAEMLDRAKAGGFAYPAFNVSQLADDQRRSCRASPRPAPTASSRSPPAAPTTSPATPSRPARPAPSPSPKFAHEVAKNYPITVALHTDHCPKDALDGLRAAAHRGVRGRGQGRRRNPIFQSHMWDGSAVPLDENIEIAQELLPRMKAINAILEVEIGVVGGEEDGVSTRASNEALYTTVADVTQAVEALGLGEQGRYIAALTFGNVHGVYKPGNVKLRPELLGEIQEGIAAKFGTGPEAARPRLPRRQRLDRRRDRPGGRQRRHQDEHRHRHPVRLHARRSRATCSATTTACSRSTARWATRRPTTRAPGARSPSRRWPRASSRRPSSSARRASRHPDAAPDSNGCLGPCGRGIRRSRSYSGRCRRPEVRVRRPGSRGPRSGRPPARTRCG